MLPTLTTLPLFAYLPQRGVAEALTLVFQFCSYLSIYPSIYDRSPGSTIPRVALP